MRDTKMYEMRMPTYRQAMADKEILSTLKYLAGARPEFLLSEIRDCFDDRRTLPELLAVVSPHLGVLGLRAEKSGDDYRIVRVPPQPPYRPDARELTRIGDFLAAGALPPCLGEGIEHYLEKKGGKAWTDPVFLSRLRRAIVAQKDDYWKEGADRRLRYTKGYSVLAYLAYHFPVYFMQTGHLLSRLAQDGLLKPSMTILDVGSGPGVVPLAVADFCSRVNGVKAAVYSIERSEEHIEAFMYLRDRCTKKGAPATIKPPELADLTVFDPATIRQPLDLLVFSNVLNELSALTPDQRADLVMRYAGRLVPDGTVLMVEPAEEASSTGLRRLSLALKKRGLTIHSPCTFVNDTNCTPDRCWSFDTAPPVRPTRVMEALAACGEPYRYVNTDIKYSYVVLRKDRNTRFTVPASAGRQAMRLLEAGSHVGRRAEILAAKMSANLGDEKTLVFRICDGSAAIPAYAVLPSYHRTPGNEAVVTAPYGALLRFSDVLVRYNPKRTAWNLLVSRNSRVADAESGIW